MLLFHQRLSLLSSVLVCLTLWLASLPAPRLANSLEAQPTLAQLAGVPKREPILLRMVDLSRWSPPVPDPMDLTYLPTTRQLLISDSELEEFGRPYWRGKNVFLAALSGELVTTHTTFTADPTALVPNNFSDEPVGVALNTHNGHWMISDDHSYRVYDIGLGADRIYGTADDQIAAFATKLCGDSDPESIAFDSAHGNLLLADGLGSEVFVIEPGANGIFDGCPPEGDDRSSHFDTSRLGIGDPEAVAYDAVHDWILISGYGATTIVVATIAGSPVMVYDIAFLKARNPSGLVYAPASANPALRSVYLTARGVDNDTVADENDGKLYELNIEVPSTPTPTPSATVTVEPTSTSIATPSPGPSQPLFQTYIPKA